MKTFVMFFGSTIIDRDVIRGVQKSHSENWKLVETGPRPPFSWRRPFAVRAAPIERQLAAESFGLRVFYHGDAASTNFECESLAQRDAEYDNIALQLGFFLKGE